MHLRSGSYSADFALGKSGLTDFGEMFCTFRLGSRFFLWREKPAERGLVVSGCATAAMDDGCVIEMKAGDLFHIAPGHDSWVVGDEPYVSLHFLGAGEYAQKK